MTSRRLGRVWACQGLYAWEFTHAPSAELLEFPWLSEKEKKNASALLFASLLLGGTLDHREEVDRAIDEVVRNWVLERIFKADLAILRMSVYTLFYQEDIPKAVVINEALEIAKSYSSEQSFQFLNGILDKIRKTS